MKNILFITALSWAAASSVSGQTVWNNIPLTGAEAKIISAARQPRFNVSLTGAFPLGGISPQNIPLATLQNAAFSPETAGQLFEKLGGQFFIGNPSGQHAQTVELAGQTQAMPGLRLGVRVGSRFEISAAAQHFQSEWSGKFPVMVLSYQQEPPAQPKTLQSSVSASVSGVLLDVETVFFVSGRGIVRPYLKGGARGQFPMQTESRAEIAGVVLPLEIEPVETSFSPFGGAGASWHFWKNAFVDAGCVFGKIPGGDYAPALEASIGWGF
jgi:hypothetical protein